MQYRTQHRTGVQISSLVPGAINFGNRGGTIQSEVTAIVDAALKDGIDLIDTADRYSRSESEEMVGKAIAGRRELIVPDKKVFSPLSDERNHQGGSRRWLVTELDNSPRCINCEKAERKIFL